MSQWVGEKRKKGLIVFKARGSLLHLELDAPISQDDADPCDDKAISFYRSFHVISRLTLSRRGRTDPTFV